MRLGAFLACLALVWSGCSSSERVSLVLYTSQDQFFAEPILRDFTKESGIDVRPVFDSESAKTAGLANRLRYEAGHPQCDIFWSNEEMHARLLAHEGVIRLEQVRTVGYRTRRLVVNTNLLPLANAPADLLSLTNEAWRGRIVLAYPLYGTTKSHFLALRQHWGNDVWKRWCEGLAANRAKIVDGNSVVVKLVGAGEAWIGLTDSDDIAAGKRDGLPIEPAPLGKEMMAIPNTVSVVSTAHQNAAEKFLNYLMKFETISRLKSAGAFEGADISEVKSGTLTIDWGRAPADLEEVEKILKEIFLRS